MTRVAVAPVGTLEPQFTGERRARSRWPGLWREVALIAVCYAVYSLVRNLVPARHQEALGRAHELYGAERTLHLDLERPLNQLFSEVTWLGLGANYYYATLHFAVTIGVLLWLYFRRPDRYPMYRWMMFGTTLAGLVGFWLYPLAPPRMLPGFVDTVLTLHGWGLYDSSPIASVSNQYAAMPSLHTGWSLWCALAVVHLARRRWVKIVAACYPVCTVIVILGTANHFLLDAVGGAVALACGFLAANLLGRVTVPVQRIALAMLTATPGRYRSG
ncbi:phosphatase PAP2 family protein [Actinomadura scrupuli]|uniref:phosphatase PAP2 family protein n=1 Tax=Actinomadura scrupuli TaxID=559629 RepID=UPI003D976A7D